MTGTDEARRVVIVTGASSGIGAATARRLAGPDVALLLHARRNEAGLARTVAAVEERGGRAASLLAELTEDGACRRLVEHAQASFGRLDQLVANAGFADRRMPGEFDRGDVASVNELMVGAFVELVDAARPHLEGSPCGSVVAVSSFVAHRYRLWPTSFPVSAAAKAGLEAMARAYAVALAPARVTVNCVVPGFTRKDDGVGNPVMADAFEAAGKLAPLGRPAEPTDVAAAIAFLLSDDARFITGQNLHVDGGLTL